MLPADVSIRMLAWPVPVMRTVDPFRCRHPTASKVPGPGWWLACGAVVRNWEPDRDRLRGRTSGVSAEHDEVYAPDQLKPGNRKWARRGAIGSAVVMLLYFWGNHEGNTENIFL